MCPPRVYFPGLCKFWQLYSGVNGDLLQEGLCHIQVCCTQSPCPCGRPLLTCTSTGDGETQSCLCLCEVPGSWCTQSLFEPSEHLWWEWGLILKANSPLLPFCFPCQTVKHLSAMRETRVRSLGREDPLEKAMATHSSTLAWKIPWTEEPGGLQSMGSQRVGHN